MSTKLAAVVVTAHTVLRDGLLRLGVDDELVADPLLGWEKWKRATRWQAAIVEI